MPMPFAVWQQEMERFPDLPSAEEWRVRSRVEVEGLPSPWLNGGHTLPPLSQTGGQELPPVNTGPGPLQAAMPGAPSPQGAPMQNPNQSPFAAGGPPDMWGMWQQAYKQSEDLDKEAAALRRQQFERGTQTLQQQSWGPSRSERLLALSAALLSPTSLPGFKGSMMNVMPTLASFATARRQAGTARDQALAKLENDYATGDLAARKGSLDQRRGFLKDALEMSKPRGGQDVWSESLQRFIPRDGRVPVDTGSLGGKPTVKYSDGTLELDNGDGTVEVYGPDGKRMGTRAAGGAN